MPVDLESVLGQLNVMNFDGNLQDSSTPHSEMVLVNLNAGRISASALVSIAMDLRRLADRPDESVLRGVLEEGVHDGIHPMDCDIMRNDDCSCWIGKARELLI